MCQLRPVHYFVSHHVGSLYLIGNGKITMLCGTTQGDIRIDSHFIYVCLMYNQNEGRQKACKSVE